MDIIHRDKCNMPKACFLSILTFTGWKMGEGYREGENLIPLGLKVIFFFNATGTSSRISQWFLVTQNICWQVCLWHLTFPWSGTQECHTFIRVKLIHKFSFHILNLWRNLPSSLLIQGQPEWNKYFRQMVTIMINNQLLKIPLHK